MPNLLIREFRKEDLADILKIERESFCDAWSEESFLREITLPFSRFLVAESRGKAVGYLIAWVVGRSCDISRIAVLSSFRRKGVGKELLKKLLDILKEEGVEEVFLEVRKSNIPAIELYRRFGFKDVGVRRGYYGEEDALLFSLKLLKEGKMLRDENLKELARKKFHHFKTLEKKHQELDDIIDKMEKKAVLTPQEEIELDRLKKERLRLRDEMMLLMKKAKEEAENEK